MEKIAVSEGTKNGQLLQMGRLLTRADSQPQQYEMRMLQ